MVFLTGDTHGDIPKKDLKRLQKTDTLIVLGDFGFVWSNSEEEQKKRKLLEKAKGTILFLDGCHENFRLLHQYPNDTYNGVPVKRIGENILWLRRGEVYTIEDKTFFVFGGGESEDMDIRIENDTWYPEEMPTEEEMERGLQRLEELEHQVDYILTHEAPLRIKEFLDPQKEYPTSLLNTYLQQINDTIEYTHWYFAHYHKNKHLGRKYTALFEKFKELP